MRKSISLLLFCGLLCSHQIYAATFPSYYCDKTFRTVKVGDTQDTVKAACGQPSSTATRQEAVSTPIVYTQWIYSLGLLKTRETEVFLPALAITFQDQKVVKIDQSGSPLANGANCAVNGSVNVGDSQEKVLIICGRPNTVNSTQEAKTTTKEVIQWIYNNGPYKPQILFNFEEGILTQIASGSPGSSS